MPYTYAYPRPALAVDCVVFGYDGTALKLLLIERAKEPFKGAFALPGGFIKMNETLDDAAKRELWEETGVKDVFLEQLYTFGAPKRDPRDRVISVAYYALARLSHHALKARSDARHAMWHPVDNLPKLAFDHNLIVQTAIARLRSKVTYQPIGFELLPKKFTLTELQRFYEAILGHELDKRNFRKKILRFGILEALGEYQEGVAHRKAEYYRFNKKKYDALVKSGFYFDLQNFMLPQGV
ncbi:MAG: NUDIX hydrolase [Candidatus Thermochlorobacter sp.]